MLLFHCCGYNLGNSQVSVNRTIGPTLVLYLIAQTRHVSAGRRLGVPRFGKRELMFLLSITLTMWCLFGGVVSSSWCLGEAA